MTRLMNEQVRAGLERKEFSLDFQPIWHVGTESVSSVECLLRWNHPVCGLLSPSMFSEAFFDKDTANDIFQFVLDNACWEFSSFSARWRQSLPRLAINVDASVLGDEALSGRIAQIARRHGVSPDMLDLEVVETADASALLSSSTCTTPLRLLGVRLICDDFGVANPPLSALSAMTIDGIKLDKEFLRGVPANPRGKAVLKSMLELSVELGLRVVAEGVENRAQFDWLANYGNVEVQGYFIGRPQPRLTDVWENLFKTA